MNVENITHNSTIVVSPSQIQYNIISPYNSVIVNDFFRNTLEMLKLYPKDLVQLKNSFKYFQLFYNTGIKRGLNLYLIPSFILSRSLEENHKLFENYSKFFNKDLIKVFIIDSSIENHKEISDLINNLRFAYFIIVGKPSIKNLAFYDLSKGFTDVYEFIKLIENDLEEIDDEIRKEYDFKIENFEFAIGPKASELNINYPTLYAHANYCMLNQILANSWLERPVNKKEDIRFFTQDRVGIMLKQSKTIDNLHSIIKEKSPVTPIEPEYPPLIIIAPFHFPVSTKELKETYTTKKERMLYRVSQTEQTSNYTFVIDEDKSGYLKKEQIAAVLKILSEKLMMLDNIGFLHAQLTYSPIYRFPVIGESINMDLSHFQNKFSDKKNAIKKINKLGELMKEKLIPEKLKETLIKRNGQIVFITDLPMEWIKLNKYPLAFTHDVCRIPQFNYNSLINNYIQNQRFIFRIKPDITERTLIIHCAEEQDSDMQKMYLKFKYLQNRIPFKSVVCKDVKEINHAVKKYKPDLLIFDCHGGFDKNTLSSYLLIDKTKDIRLTGDDIVKFGISAPIVFISACSTMPSYGYIKFLSDAFFEAGAFTVTATFLPLKISDAADLIIRILSNLEMQKSNLIFSNWLAFISHTLRSTLIFETIKKECSNNNLNEHINDEKIAEILLELMHFPSRENAFETLLDYLKTINPKINIVFEDLEHEWLSYTTIGRADLIYFENWILTHQMENYGSFH